MNWTIFNNKQKKYGQKKYHGFRFYFAVHSDSNLGAEYEKKERKNKTKKLGPSKRSNLAYLITYKIKYANSKLIENSVKIYIRSKYSI